MADIADLVRRCGGLAPTWRLVELGATRKAIAWAAGNGAIKRVRKGWYCLPDTPTLRQQAARVGGRLTEVSAAADAGVWAPPSDSLHVALAPNACRPRERDHFRRRLNAESRLPVTLYWNDSGDGGDRFTVAVPVWVRDVVSTRSLSVAAGVADSALQLGVLKRVEWAAIRASLPSERRASFGVIDGIPESGTESMVRMALHLAGIESTPQVWVTDRIRVDLLIGDRLVVEVVSQKHHGSREQRLRDLARTAELVRLGYHVLEFDYAQIMSSLDTVVATVQASVDGFYHLAPEPRSRLGAI
jgi:very-short-patch-repair endonuclease